MEDTINICKIFKLYFVKNELTFICLFSDFIANNTKRRKKSTIIRKIIRLVILEKAYLLVKLKPKLLNVLLNGIKDNKPVLSYLNHLS